MSRPRRPGAALPAACLFAVALAGCGGEAEPAGPAEQVRGPSAGHLRMLRALQGVLERSSANEFVAEGAARELRGRARRLDDLPSVEERGKVLVRLGKIELRLGNERPAIDALERALALVEEHPGLFGSKVPALARFELGVAWMRLGETENCCARRNEDSCLLPIRGGGIHSVREGSERAIGHFRSVFDDPRAPPDLRRSARWLLNIAAMTLGEHPDGLEPEERIPPDAFLSDEPFPRFRNVSPEVGVDNFGLSGGAAADDFDGDGDLDLVVSDWDPAAQMRYWRNEDGRFVDRTREAGLEGLLGGLNLVQADYDNDGDLDVLVLRGAWLEEVGCQPNSLLRNDGRGVFEDVTFEAGIAEPAYPTQTAAWADYDNDGDLDLYVGNETSLDVHAPCQLFRNEGDGTFVDVAHRAGVREGGYAKAVAWGDYDGDRWPDLYVSNFEGPNRLYRNRGDGTFENVAPRLGVTGPEVSFPAWFWDFDNDGALDLFVSAYSAGIDDLAVSYAGEEGDFELARLYRGDGRGGFVDVAREAGLVRPMLPMGSNFGDLDGDGWLDFYLGTGSPGYRNLMPNLMYRNREGRGFADVTTAGGFGHLQKGHAVVFADLDGDGDQDVFEQMGGAYPGDAFADTLYENPGFGHGWLAVRLVGTRSNRYGVGARVRVDVVEDGHTRSIYRHVGTGGSFGANPLRLEIGLGEAERIAALEVHWPTSDTTQRFTDVGLDRWVVVTEGAARLEERALPHRALGGKAPTRVDR